MQQKVFQRGSLLAVAVLALVTAGCGDSAPLGPVANAKSATNIRDLLAKGGGADSGAAGAASTGTGWATLSGRFVFTDPTSAPKMQPYNVTKDPQFCTDGGKAPLQESLKIASDGGIQNIVIFLRNPSRVHDAAKAATDPIVFDQKMCLFLSHVLGVSVGQKVDIKNSDPTGHNTKIDGQGNKFNQTVEAGKTIDYVMQKAEVTPAEVTCSIHPWMHAYLIARPDRYFAVTAADGTFKIENLPAGEDLEFQVWQESAAGPSQVLVVPATPETRDLKWSNRGRFKVNLQEGQVKDIPISVPPSAFKS